jgi:hypothetical protein
MAIFSSIQRTFHSPLKIPETQTLPAGHRPAPYAIKAMLSSPYLLYITAAGSGYYNSYPAAIKRKKIGAAAAVFMVVKPHLLGSC